MLSTIGHNTSRIQDPTAKLHFPLLQVLLLLLDHKPVVHVTVVIGIDQNARDIMAVAVRISIGHLLAYPYCEGLSKGPALFGVFHYFVLPWVSCHVWTILPLDTCPNYGTRPLLDGRLKSL
jgi:hypothetical protein